MELFPDDQQAFYWEEGSSMKKNTDLLPVHVSVKGLELQV